MKILTCDSWRDWCDRAFWCNEGPCGDANFQPAEILFCKIDEVLKLFERLRLTRKKIVLVTGEGDLPCDAFRQKFLPVNVVRWFATNVTSAHPRVTTIPLGLGSPRSAATLRSAEILELRSAGIPRDRWLFVNFRPDTNPSVRQPVFDHFQRESRTMNWITFQPPAERGTNAEFLEAIVRHRFVLCPPGNGVDTHRMWETLLAGATPVVLQSQAMRPFSELPILFVEDFREVTKEFLEKALEARPGPAEIHPVMTSDFWQRKIHEARDEISKDSTMGWGKWAAEALSYGIEMVGRRLKPKH